MTIISQVNKITEAGNGSKTDFDFPFKIFSEDELVVYTVNQTTGVAVGPLTLNTDYTVLINTDSEGGTVTYASAVASTDNSFIERVVPYTQSADLQLEGVFNSEQVENQLDLAVMMVIQLNETLSRTAKVGLTSSVTDLTLPDPQDGYVLAWDGTSGALKNVLIPTGDVSTIASQVATDAASAAASATAAAASATAAAASAAGITDSNLVHKTGDETIAGVKTLTSIPVLPASNPSTANQATRKSYVDGKFDVSTGHDHDGSDSKKVLATNLDLTGITNGQTLYNNSGTVAGKDDANNVSYAAGSYLIAGPSNTITARSTSYTKRVEMYVPRSGTLRIIFGLSNSGGDTAFGKIYRNGVAVGTEHSTTGGWAEYSEDISGWSAGDLLQLYIKNQVGDQDTVAGAVRVFENTPVRETFGSGGQGNINGAFLIYSGAGVPPAAMGIQGDLYIRTDGSTSTTLYVKTGASTWTAK